MTAGGRAGGVRDNGAAAAARRWNPCCVCIQRSSCEQWMTEPSRVAEGVGLNAQEHRQIKIAIPAKNQETARQPAGLFPVMLRHSQGLGPFIHFPRMQGK